MIRSPSRSTAHPPMCPDFGHITRSADQRCKRRTVRFTFDFRVNQLESEAFPKGRLCRRYG
jgi:hypothetical protein